MATTSFIVSGAEGSTAPGIKNDGWFPDISPVEARAAMRMDGTVTDERLRQALINGMSSVNAELRAWKRIHEYKGFASMDMVPMSERHMRRHPGANFLRYDYPWPPGVHTWQDDDAPEVPASIINIDGENIYLHLYRRAVYCLASAECVDRLRSYDLGKTGQDNTPEQDATHMGLMRDARYAIADIIGINRTVIDLI